MKKKALTVLLIIFNLALFAQDKALLTKEETVNYLEKKVKETIGHYLTIEYGENIKRKLYYWDTSVKMIGDKIIFNRERSSYKEEQYADKFFANGYQYSYPCDYVTNNDELSFNPAHVLKIEPYTDKANNDPVGSIKITLKSNSGLIKRTVGATRKKITDMNSDHYGKCVDFKEESNSESTYDIYISYLKADDTNFNKIKKALEYLRDLMKAEDDPFGE